MTDTNGMTFTNIQLSKSICTAGETLTASVTVKNGTGVNIPDFRLNLICHLGSFTGNAADDRAITLFGFTFGDNLPKGKTVSYTQTLPVSNTVGEYFAQYPAVRAVPVYIMYEAYNTAMGNFGRRDARVEDFAVVRARYCPQLTQFSLQRCISGVPSDEGENALASAKAEIADRAGLSFLQLRLHYAENTAATVDSAYFDLTDRIDDLLSGLTDSADLIPDRFSNGSNWDFLLFLGDDYESAVARQSFSRAFANLHLSGAKTGGACFGGFSASQKGDPRLECHYPGYFYGGIHGVNIFSALEEKTGGRWLDNKPIYTRVLVLTAAASKTTHDISVPTDIETAWIDPSGSFCVVDGLASYPVSYSSSGGVAVFQTQYRPDLHVVRVATQTGSKADFYIKIFYTKTTDDAIDPVQTHLPFLDSSGAQFIDANGSGLMTEVY